MNNADLVACCVKDLHYKHRYLSRGVADQFERVT